jgi:L-aspartate oxidase
MGRIVGIERDEQDLKSAAEQVSFWDRYVSDREFADPTGWELQNLLLVARLVIQAALARTESRGVHFRSDFPQTDLKQSEHIALAAV